MQECIVKAKIKKVMMKRILDKYFINISGINENKLLMM